MRRVTRYLFSVSVALWVFLTFAWADTATVRIIVSGREVRLTRQPIYDGSRVLALVELLDQLGVNYVVSDEGRSVIVITRDSKSEIIDLVEIGGAWMVPLDRIAAVVGWETGWDASNRTFTLYATLESVEFVDNTLKVNCSMPVDYTVRVWDGKIIVDVTGAKLKTPANEVYIGDPVVRKARLGQYDANTARVVLDMEKAAGFRVTSAKPATAISVLIGENLPISEPSRVMAKPGAPVKPVTVNGVSLRQLSENEFELVLETSGRAAVAPAYGVNPPQVVVTLKNGRLAESFKKLDDPANPLLTRLSVKETHSSPTAVRVQMDFSRVVASDVRVEDKAVVVLFKLPANAGGRLAEKIIVLDPGHGGKDRGASFNGVLEKDINLKIARGLAEELRRAGAKVILTRDGDTRLSLAERAEVAIKNGAHLFVSIHCNSNGIPNSATGIETYYHREEPSPRALGYSIHAGMCSFTGMCDRRARSDTSLYSLGLGVLRRLSSTGIPGVLLECGFMNHSSDHSKLLDDAYRKKLIGGIVAGLKAYVEGTPINN
jgi:N-acetylmuramoyl-L-alanine amidase